MSILVKSLWVMILCCLVNIARSMYYRNLPILDMSLTKLKLKNNFWTRSNRFINKKYSIAVIAIRTITDDCIMQKVRAAKNRKKKMHFEVTYSDLFNLSRLSARRLGKKHNTWLQTLVLQSKSIAQLHKKNLPEASV